MEKICYIFGAGEPSLPAASVPRDEVLVIAADGGYPVACEAFGSPDLAVGDFDSLGYLPARVPILRHPPEKDDTDLALAADVGLARGCRCFRIFSALGGRLDHTLANLQLLARLAAAGCEATLYGADGVAVTALCGPATLTLAPACGTVSVLAHGGTAEGVTLRGLKYPLEGASLSSNVPLGISNELLGEEASVSLVAGTLLVFYPSENAATHMRDPILSKQNGANNE